MFVQTVRFGLNETSESEYLDIANEVAPQYSSIPGLLAKLWLDKAEDGAYGAVYFWEDQESMERYCRGDLFEGSNPGFAGVVSNGAPVLENLTRSTQPVLEVLPARQRAGRA